MTNIFELSGRFLRGNIHTHSSRSDGALDPAEVCRRYKAEGYDFLAITDHLVGCFGYPIVDTQPYRDADFTTILGAELHSGAMESGDIWHILAVGLPTDFKPPNTPEFRVGANQETGPEVARRARDAGAFVAIAHPEWSGLTMQDARSLDAAHAVEIYNHGCAMGADRPHGFHTLDLLLNDGHRLNLCATDDAHFAEPDYFGGWVMVKAEANDPGLLLDALKAGHYYASTGPEIHNIIWQQNSVVVESSPASGVMVQGKAPQVANVAGENMTRTEVPLDRLPTSPWLRVTVRDNRGRRAWSNPVWREDLNI